MNDREAAEGLGQAKGVPTTMNDEPDDEHIKIFNAGYRKGVADTSHPTPDSGETDEKVYVPLPRIYAENKRLIFSTEDELVAATVQAATVQLDNIKLVATAELPAEYTDPVSGKKLYNEASVQAAQVELLDFLEQDLKRLDSRNWTMETLALDTLVARGEADEYQKSKRQEIVEDRRAAHALYAILANARKKFALLDGERGNQEVALDVTKYCTVCGGGKRYLVDHAEAALRDLLLEPIERYFKQFGSGLPLSLKHDIDALFEQKGGEDV